MTHPSKRCFKCGQIKPLSEFYKHPKMADGHVNKCKECNKKDVNENRGLKIEYYREYDRQRMDGRSNEAKKNWMKNNPIKKAAQLAVSSAIKKGLLIKPTVCENCGKTDCRIEGHHESYEKEFWLSVNWLCSVCHRARHKVKE